MKALFTALAAGAALVGVASAATQSATFDSDAEGFTTSGFGITWTATGGNPDGYIRLNDTVGGVGTLSVGPDLLVPLMVGGQISVDATFFSGSGRDHVGFGELTLSGGGFQRTVDMIAGNPPVGSWETYSVDLTAATWGLSDVDFATMLANIDAITLVVETTVGVNEVLGIDNFTVDTAAVPVPAAALLFAPLAGAALRRRRQR
ncbi:MAG: hypothetical protein HRU11_11935 [Parvularculaceae bacterium]|nr:hypothetical protein [Parvularculaceae bacterium]